MGLFGKKYDEMGFEIKSHNHKDTGTLYNLQGYDFKGFDKDGFDSQGWNKEGIHTDTGTRFFQGFDKDGFNEYGRNAAGWDTEGFGAHGNHINTGTKFNEDGFDKEGYNEDGWNKEGIHKDTGTRFFHGYDQNGFNPDGWNDSGINKTTATNYDEEGFTVNGWNDDGFYKSGLLAKYNTIEFNMIPFKGQEKFAKLRSGGTVDFYDSDSPAYILNVKLNDCSHELKEKLILKIRHSFHIKPSVFPTEKSIGAYWQTDLIEKEVAKVLLKRIITNFSNSV